MNITISRHARERFYERGACLPGLSLTKSIHAMLARSVDLTGPALRLISHEPLDGSKDYWHDVESGLVFVVSIDGENLEVVTVLPWRDSPLGKPLRGPRKELGWRRRQPQPYRRERLIEE